jgi:hypothetical protein
MAVIALTHKEADGLQALLLEEGAQSERWSLAADARIKDEADPVGVGPVAYKGRTLDAEGNYSSDGTIQQAMFMFFDGDACTYAIVDGQAEADINDTVADFLANHGGDKSAMQSLKPTVA